MSQLTAGGFNLLGVDCYVKQEDVEMRPLLVCNWRSTEEDSPRDALAEKEALIFWGIGPARARMQLTFMPSSTNG